jgi:PWWP domain
LDLWLFFGNCVKYNSHPNNKDAVPSFVSIALHLREYLNNLWQEFMMPSDLSLEGSAELREVTKAAFIGRARDRKRRIESSGVLIVSREYVARIAESLALLVQTNGGRVDRLDPTAVFSSSDNGNHNKAELTEIVQRINEYKQKLQDFVQSEDGGDLQLEALYDDLKRTCFGEDLNELSETRNWVFGRLDRWFWKIATPLHEANCRGVAQSSIWGNIAACIWARESGKKPYWPALCLGILPPTDQRETWHDAVTERNESRLPEKLRGQLQTAKKRCEQAQKRQSLSYFLVEFLGTHEFIWVKESDIVEEFDPEQDPNKTVKAAGGKKGRPSRTTASAISDNKTYQKALQECLWANTEYENVLSDALKRDGDADDDEADDSMSYSALAQLDGERDDDVDDNVEYGFDEDAMSATDVEDLNYILTHNGLIDPDGLTRKGGKKKKPPPKKIPVGKKDETLPVPAKAVSSKAKTKVKDDAGNDQIDKKDLKEAEKRRKKRTREFEKVLLAEERKKRRRFGTEGNDQLDDDELNFDKRARATIVANAYLMRLKNKEDVKSFALSGVMGMPVASVDSIGLLGMTLAFRAASGMLRMPDEGVDDECRRCPWKEITVAKVKSSTERAVMLQKKLELMNKELERVQRNTDKRLEWTACSNSTQKAAMARIDAADKTARQNPYKIKKKASSSPKPKSLQTPKSVPPSPGASSDNSISGDVSTTEIPVSEVEAIATHDTNDSSMPDEDESAVEVEAMVLDD